ncbi:MAG TPA: hypothetical protein VFS00_18595, partial [Polyangiaceae bacterium]|nr:hypothetical protein [Polyangiaceae bacterium]
VEFGPQGASVYFALEREGAAKATSRPASHGPRGGSAPPPDVRPPSPAAPSENGPRKPAGDAGLDRSSPW